MPQRFLRPGITNSDAWNSVSFEAQSLYIRILTLVDDFGRYDGRVPVLHGQCFALRPDVKPQRTAGFRSELQTAGLIDVYEVDGKEFIQMTKWTERARGDKSKFPDPVPVTEESSDPQDSAAERSAAQRKDASIGHRPSPLHPRPSPSVADATAGEREAEAFTKFWTAYPKKEGKGKAEEAWRVKKCTPHIDAILATIDRYKGTDQWNRENMRFVPLPTTWLNQKRWEDEPAAPEDEPDSPLFLTP